MTYANSTLKEKQTLKIRKAAVAGQFYSDDADALKQQIHQFLDTEKTVEQPVRMLISPHAGYVFSGPVAGYGYAAIDTTVHTVIVIGPTHHVPFQGISIPDVDAYETPLGTIPLNKACITKLRSSPLTKAIPEAHNREHCLEVQLPFLQETLKDFSLVPIICGQGLAPEDIAALLDPVIDEKTLVIASTDLSHFHSNEKARELDEESIETILSGNSSGPIDACGEMPIRVIMALAAKRGLSPVLLDARNSFQTAPVAYKNPGRVVGYVSIAYIKKDLSLKEYLLGIAKKSLHAAVMGEKNPEESNPHPEAEEPKGCFVTLEKNGQLRGCIGYIDPIKPLYQAVIENARNAALKDFRFPPVSPDELGEITLEVSVLTVPQKIAYTSPDDLLKQITAGQDGIILQSGVHTSTYLPQVWEQIPDKVSFLEHLAVKGGMNRNDWKTATVKKYQATAFHDE